MLTSARQMSKIENSLLINSFLQVLTIEDGLAKNTIISYQNDLELLAEFLKSKKSDFLNCDEKLLNIYLEKLYKDDILASSVSRKISAFKSFFKFLVLENHLKKNPVLNIITPKKGQKLPKVLSEAEILKLLEAVSSDDSEFGIRLNCMMEILYASGMRVTELVTLPISTIQKTIDEDGKHTYKNYLFI